MPQAVEKSISFCVIFAKIWRLLHKAIGHTDAQAKWHPLYLTSYGDQTADNVRRLRRR